MAISDILAYADPTASSAERLDLAFHVAHPLKPIRLIATFYHGAVDYYWIRPKKLVDCGRDARY